mmetsp:Transcript_811/g.2373  ORF Transcript_811/g.2373 Transcript_811/m.2373 type:complete len:243 (+) Transcript_811:370-1098(+)
MPVGSDGRAPLQWAAMRGQAGAMQLLLNHGAAVNRKDPGSGDTALFSAVEGGHANAVKMLLDHNATFDEPHMDGRTLLERAATRSSEVLRMLLEHGADPDEPDILTNATPLYFAVQEHSETSVKVLLEFGADLDHEDNDGMTVLEWARQCQTDPSIVAVLEDEIQLRRPWTMEGHRMLSRSARAFVLTVVMCFRRLGIQRIPVPQNASTLPAVPLELVLQILGMLKVRDCVWVGGLVPSRQR